MVCSVPALISYMEDSDPTRMIGDGLSLWRHLKATYSIVRKNGSCHALNTLGI